jgi:dTDP-4-amino-4,6-dideoxygalactose transaminase
MNRDELNLALKEHGIYSRKYFYPLISNISMYSNIQSAGKEKLSIANKIADEVLCLPLYGSLGLEDIDRIIVLIHYYKN